MSSANYLNNSINLFTVSNQQCIVAGAREKAMSADTPRDKENREKPLGKASSIPNLPGVGSKIPLVNKFKTPVDRIKRPLKAMNTQ